MSREQARVAQDGQVRKTVPYVAAWFVAGVAAVVLASAGVSMVSRQVTGSRPAPLSAEQVREELAADDDDPGAGTTTTTTAPAGPTTTTAPAGPTTTLDSSPSTPGGVGSPATTPPAGGSPGSGSPGAVAPTTTAAPPPPATAATTRTYNLVGGTATLRFTPDGVTVVVATPKAGFSVDVGDSDDGDARVEFESDEHRSRVDAWWDGGPQDEVREED